MASPPGIPPGQAPHNRASEAGEGLSTQRQIRSQPPPPYPSTHPTPQPTHQPTPHFIHPSAHKHTAHHSTPKALATYRMPVELVVPEDFRSMVPEAASGRRVALPPRDAPPPSDPVTQQVTRQARSHAKSKLTAANGRRDSPIGTLTLCQVCTGRGAGSKCGHA